MPPAQDLKLTRAQRRQFAIALQSAYWNWDQLNLLLHLELDTPLVQITAPGPHGAVVLSVIAWAEGIGKTQELIEAANRVRPSNPDLRAFVLDLAASKAGVIQATAPIWQALERAVLAGVPFDNPSQFRDRMSQAERAVCRLVLPKPEWGTGFLVGRDTLLTNYHVIEDIHIGATQPDKVTVEFDYISGPNGEKPLKVISCKLAEKWLLAYSETASLDFALVRLERSIGDQPAAQQSDGKRSWLKPVSYVFDAGNPEPIFILQHPQLEPDQSTDPLKVTVGFVNGAPNGTRVHYTTNTMFGSSGSPCFRANWDLVALHHSATGKPANEGIPLKAILDNLMKRNPPVSVGE